MVMNVESGSLSPTLIVIVVILSRDGLGSEAGKSAAELMRLCSPSQVEPAGSRGRSCDELATKSAPQRRAAGSGHGPGRLRGARVADEGQAQRPTLELACVARAREVDLEAHEIVAGIGFQTSLAIAARVGHPLRHRYIKPVRGLDEQVGSLVALGKARDNDEMWLAPLQERARARDARVVGVAARCYARHLLERCQHRRRRLARHARWGER